MQVEIMAVMTMMMRRTPALLSYGTSLMLILQIALAVFSLQPSAEVGFDEELPTASDYSIKINNSPPGALDPAEWRGCFLSNLGVSYVTVAINNTRLLQKLIMHKTTLRRLARKVPADCDIWDKEQVEEALICDGGSMSYLSLSARSLWTELQRIRAYVEKLARMQ